MYNNINPKYKSFLFFLIKLSIIGGSLYFIYKKIVFNDAILFDDLLKNAKNTLLKDKKTVPLLFLITFFNWFFEIWKWKVLVKTFKTISFYEATKQSLAALTVSLLTPNRLGDYGAKALYFTKNKWRIMLLNLAGNISQLTITVLFGFFGLYFFITTFNIEIQPYKLRKIGYFIAMLLLIPFASKKVKFGRIFKTQNSISFLKKTPLKTHFIVFVFSLIRYVVFSHQFYFLLVLFEAKMDYFTAINLIFTMYFMASFIPSISLFDWAIKGSVAIYVFAFAGVQEPVIITVTVLMWILNFAIPSIIGSAFVLNFKFKNT